MASDLCTRRLARELKSIQKSPLTDPTVYTTPLENNLLEWHYVIEGSKDSPYEGGYYWGEFSEEPAAKSKSNARAVLLLYVFLVCFHLCPLLSFCTVDTIYYALPLMLIYHVHVPVFCTNNFLSIGKLIFPKQYPLKPPSVMMLTPNGRFKTNRRLCLSMSDFHPESWNPMWSVSTIITGLISFMVETAPTLGSIETSTTQKHFFAKHSLEYNVKDAQFQKLFPELVEKHKQLMEERIKTMGEQSFAKEREEMNRLMKRSSSEKGGREFGLQGLLATFAGIVALVSIFFAMRTL